MSQESGTHTVVEGDTLWEIAIQYFRDGHQWPRIFDANRDRISDPNRIEPGMVLVIPGRGAEVTAVEVVTDPVDPAQPAEAMPAQPARMTPGTPQERPGPTVFRQAARDTSTFGMSRNLLDVPPELFYGAPWLIPLDAVPAAIGHVEGFSGGETVRSARTSARVFHRLNVRLEGAAPPAGTRLQTLRLGRDIPDVGQVVIPTGTLVVEAAAPGGVVAVVESQFARLLVGDLVRPLPAFTARPAEAIAPATGGAEATILAFALDHELQSVGDHAFLDVGSEQGVRIGDEYVVVWSDAPEWNEEVEGRVKVVSVLPGVSTARILEVENPVFIPGVRLRPSRRVP